ncbi:hypothetical protein HRbin36_02233 [bacterium HR36]|nr:hypothetical protein HRbin36_02233 [bacterium HR36]
MIAPITANVEQNATITEFHGLTLVTFRTDAATNLPAFAMVVAVNDMRTPHHSLRRGLLVIARDYQAPACQLDTYSWPRGVPGPAKPFYLCGNVGWPGPSLALIIAVGEPNGARAFCRAIGDCGFGVFTEIVGHQ